MQYLFDKWDKLKEKLKDRYLFIFLDFDGTLTPIVKTPERALLSSEARHLLKALSEDPRCKVAIISGRSLDDLKDKIKLNSLIYSGNHGLEIEGPKLKFTVPVPASYKRTLNEIKKFLSKEIARYKGAFVENKGLSLTLHFRLADNKRVPMIKAAFHEATILPMVRNKVKIKAGKKVLEIRPISEWDKGKVVLWLLARQTFAEARGEVLPVYIGDDLTDEDAFKVLKGRGITIYVGKPKQSYAQYYVRDSNAVVKFLGNIL